MMKVPLNYKPPTNTDGTTLLTSAKTYAYTPPVIPKHRLTKLAESKEWDIFTPDWDRLRTYPTAEILSLTAQSVGINPDFSNYDWLNNHALPYFESIDDGGKCTVINYFIIRFDDLYREYIYPCGDLKPIQANVKGEPVRFKRVDFVALAVRINWILPPEFSSIPIVIQEQQAEAVGNAGAVDDTAKKKPKIFERRLDVLKKWLQEDLGLDLSDETIILPKHYTLESVYGALGGKDSSLFLCIELSSFDAHFWGKQKIVELMRGNKAAII